MSTFLAPGIPCRMRPSWQDRRASIFGSRMTISRLVAVLILALSIGPVLAVDIPAMLDYPNHLAVMSVLSRNGTAAANPFYQLTWNFNTNLAMELFVPPLARLIGLEAAGKTFLLFSQFLVIGGAMAIERVVKGRLELSPFAAALFLYSVPFAWGFVNFEFGLGVALCAIAAWLLTEGRPPFVRALLHSVFVVVIFVAHLFALGIYGATVGLHELWRLRSGWSSVRQAFLTAAILAAPVIVVFGVMMILGHSVVTAANHTQWWFQFKPGWVFEALNGYSVLLSSVITLLILFASFVTARRGHLKLLGSGWWIAVGFAFLYAAMPGRLFDAAFNDVRIVTAAALILPAFVQLSFANVAWRRAAFWTATACAVANLVLVWWVWLSYRPEYAAIISSFHQMAKGSTVLVANSYPPAKAGGSLNDYPFYHAPTLAVAYGDALVPSLFTGPGDRPVTLRPAYRQFLKPVLYLTPDISALPAIASGAYEDAPLYLQSWTSKYDYLYVIGPRAPNPMPLLLRELDAGPSFVLYRIDKSTKVP
jgi:hypothetical protein